ncbi:transglutaminase-like cysteine peptidase [Qipengyuania sphaerica]|uniref:transglutaminase-like cysteine peptidase n=1 Tax=Qipengyuania sphaerica TaxID=2867243 RepID=UPI001C8A5266|nr:transglutaminase-like cysteine peptidase [Qipengyuania sphaerica]MBX7542013.1 transglutaminase-like cysteine peptidase [Qipengyuania sphaerica]
MGRLLALLCAGSAIVAIPALRAQDILPEARQAIILDIPEPPSGCVEPAGEAEEPEGFRMPTTGAVFTLPPVEDDTASEPCVDPGPPPPVRPPAPSLFRMVALPIGKGATSMQKWEEARSYELGGMSGPWDEVLSQANRVTGGNPVAMINTWVNWRVRYEDDRAGDVWSSAPTTLTRGFGDCEDFALAKMALLRELGIPADDMYLVLLRDRQKTDHAVLAVKQGSHFMILDNRTDKVLPATMVFDYTPTFGFSGPFAWTYGKPAS